MRPAGSPTPTSTNVVDEFVDLMNGRDFDELDDLFAAAEAGFLGGMSREDVVGGLSDLLLRYPTLLVTRADLGSEPLVAVWTFDTEVDRFDSFGFLTFEMTESDEALISRLGYVDELSESDAPLLRLRTAPTCRSGRTGPNSTRTEEATAIAGYEPITRSVCLALTTSR